MFGKVDEKVTLHPLRTRSGSTSQPLLQPQRENVFIAVLFAINPNRSNKYDKSKLIMQSEDSTFKTSNRFYRCKESMTVSKLLMSCIIPSTPTLNIDREGAGEEEGLKGWHGPISLAVAQLL